MRLPRYAPPASALAASLLLAGLAGSTAQAAKLDLPAAWAASPVAVDGKLDDWKGRLLTTVDAPLAVGAVNDGEFLYVALSSSDAAVARRAYFRGLVVRIKPKKGTEIGIRYPTGEGRRARRRPPEPPPAETASDSFLMLGQGSSEGQRIAVDNPFGIEVKAALVDGKLAYELKVPLHRSAAHPYALDARDGGAVTLEIETPEPDRGSRPARPERGEGGESGEGGEGGGEGGWGGGGMHHHGGYGHGGGMGGMGGMGGGYGHGGGGMEGGGYHHGGPGGGRPAPIKIEAKLRLATAPATK